MKRRSKWFSKSFWVSIGAKAAGAYLISQGHSDAGTMLIAASNGGFNISQGAEDHLNPEHDAEEGNPVNSRKFIDTLVTGAMGAFAASQGLPTEAAALFGTAAVSYAAGEAISRTGKTHRDI